jgi:hypothetical protein
MAFLPKGPRVPRTNVSLGLKANVQSIRAWRNRVDDMPGGRAKREEAIIAGFSKAEIDQEFGVL